MVIGQKNPDGTLSIHEKPSLRRKTPSMISTRIIPKNISNGILHFCNTNPNKNTITQKGGFTPLTASSRDRHCFDTQSILKKRSLRRLAVLPAKRRSDARIPTLQEWNARTNARKKLPPRT
jgi:hypothetical protein